MARTIGEGLVRVRPDTSQFGPDAERSMVSALQRTVSRLESVLNRLEPIAARAGQAAGRRFASGVDRETSRLRPLLNGLFRVSGAAVLGGGMAYVAAQAIALTSAIIPAIGTILGLPGAAVTAAAGLGVLAIATRGLGDALTQESARGGGAAQAGARAVEAATRAYEAAQKRVVAAQRDATRAARDLIEVREEEAERIRRNALDVEGAALAEEAAARRVKQAETELAAAKAKSKPDAAEIDEAAFALKEANHALKEAKARHEELAAEQAESARVGVEGSEAVQDALERQREAEAAVAEAKKEAAAAQKEIARAGESAGGGGGVSKAAEAYAKLAPSAQAVVRVIRELRPAWDRMARSVQQRVWAGVAGDVRGLSDRYLPVLTNRLGDVGGAWNTAIRQSAKLAMSKGFVRDVDTTLGNAAATSDRLARAVAPVVSGLRHIGVVGSSVLPGLAGDAQNLAERFEAWTARARESGQLERWLRGGLDVLRQLGTIALNVGGIITAIFRAGGAEAGGDMLSGLEAGTARLRAFLNSAEGQERISTVLNAVRDVVEGVVASLPALVSGAETLAPALSQAAGEGGSFRDTLAVGGTVVGFLADHLDTLITLLPWLAAGFVLVKGAQTAANLAAVAMVPIKIAEVAANWGLRASMNAHTAALVQNTAVTRAAAGAQAAETAATNGGIIAKGRAVVATTAQRVAAVAANVATKAWAAGQWLLNAAMSANPLGLVLIAIVALIAGIVLLWRNSETFRTIVTAAFNAVWSAIKFVWDWASANWPLLLAILTGPIGLAVLFIVKHWDQIKASAAAMWRSISDGATSAKDWIVGKFTAVVSFFDGLPGKIAAKARGLFDGPVSAARGGINMIIDAWNRLDFGMSVQVPDWVPGIGGKGFSIPDLFPDVPRLAAGGVARARPGGILANIAEGGEDEAVAPLSALAAMITAAVREAGGGGRGVNVEKLEVKAFTDRFSLRQVQEELAMHGAH
ncbi:hypothetical protein [Micromonospora inyonensis]|uniref:Phage-related protein n=1 Tax=Micromonospora inyonensis TaxID=47866 RepID=A0A1C6RD20_9ACTN|nr:hypothetical protein [Micromonospora inyonensis]SCL15047.1 hypothetical protein GA0074694_1029 [Micromonospora inyonensis]